MDTIVNVQLEKLGLRPRRALFGGVPVELEWTPDPQNPVLDDRVLVALPDLHLGDGGKADIFRGTAGGRHRARFTKFLRALVACKQELARSNRRLSVVQVGDCYDVWRAFPFHSNIRGRTYAAIQAAYAEIIALLVDELDTRFCVGNHDSVLATSPPDWGFGGGRIAYAQRFCSGRVFAFHGHQGDQLADELAGQHGQTWVALGSTLAGVANAAGMALQKALDRHEDAFPGDDGGWPEGPSPEAGSRWRARRWSDYGPRRGRFERVLAAMAQASPAVERPVQLLLVGHTHRPGVTWLAREGRTIPVVDVGSWTYGRSQFGVVTEGNASLWEL